MTSEELIFEFHPINMRIKKGKDGTWEIYDKLTDTIIYSKFKTREQARNRIRHTRRLKDEYSSAMSK